MINSSEQNRILTFLNKIFKKTPNYNIGFCSIWHVRGITFLTKQLSDTLEADGFKTCIYARWESAQFTDIDPVFHPRVYNAGDDPSPENMVRWAKENNIKILVQMESHPSDWKRLKALKDAGVTLICYENLDILRVAEFDEYNIYDYFLFNSFYTRKVFIERFPQTPGFLLPWGIEEKYVKNYNKENNKVPVFLHVSGWGGVNNRKNTDLVIRAFSKVDNQNVQLKLYSQKPISSYGKECELIVNNDDRITLIEGTVDDIFKVYAGADLLIWPSKREGLGLPIMEALVSGVPVLISDGYMMKQWPINKEHALLCPGTAIEDQMFLPELDVDENVLVTILNNASRDLDSLKAMKKNVIEDRNIWLWSWQKDVFIGMMKKIIDSKFTYIPPKNLSYIPSDILEFEKRRKNSYGE